jgi:hypothetical protein
MVNNQACEGNQWHIKMAQAKQGSQDAQVAS